MDSVSFKFFHRHIHGAQSTEKTHSHPCHEVVYYLRGKGQGMIADSSYDYIEGTWVYIPSGKKHSEYHETETEVLFFAFEAFETDEELLEGLSCDENGEVYQFFLKIEDEVKKRKPLFGYAINLLIEQMLLEIKRSRIISADSNLLEECMHFAKNYISAHIQQKITIGEIAELVGYSYDYFRHQFFKYFGVSPKEFIINERISRSKKRLIESDDSIAKIAERYSFDSPSHFTRIFKKNVGISPLEYRNTQRKVQGEIQVKYENSAKTDKE